MGLTRLVRNQRGQAMVEYAFLLLLIAMVVFTGLKALGVSLQDFFTSFVSLM